MIIDTLEWTCEKCGFVNGLQIDDEMGPCKQDMCGGCDSVFDIDYLRGKEHAKPNNNIQP